VVEVLDSILTPPDEGMEMLSDQVGVNLVVSSENYGRYLLGALEGQGQDNLTLLKENLGKWLATWGEELIIYMCRSLTAQGGTRAY